MGLKPTMKIGILSAAVLMALAPAGTGLAQGRQASVVLSGSVQHFDKAAYLEDGAYFLPVRELLEKLGYQVSWSEQTSSIVADKPGVHRIELTPDRSTAHVDAGLVDMEQKVRITDGTAYMPAVVLLERLGYAVETDGYQARLYVKFPVWQRIGEALATGSAALRIEEKKTEGGAASEVTLYLDGELVYSGAWRNGAMAGGKVYDGGRLIYEGGIAGNMPEGAGIRYDVSGGRYEGDFKAGVPQGKGRLYVSGKLLYDGEWSLGRMEGNGKLYSSNGKVVYEGGMSNGKRYGYGVLFSESGTKVYEGNWTADVRSGYGKSFGTDGKIEYAGSWSGGLKNGGGTVYRYGTVKSYTLNGTNVTSSKEVNAVYMRDVEYAKGYLITQSSKELVYTGTFSEDGEPNGDGELGYVTGTIGSEAGVLNNWQPYFKGTFKSGSMAGTGAFYDSKGQAVYKGGVSEGMRNGQGAAYENNLMVYYGGWMNDQRNGKGWLFQAEDASSPYGTTSYTMTEVYAANGNITNQYNKYKVYLTDADNALTGTGVQIWIYDALTGSAPDTINLTTVNGGKLVYTGDLVNGLREGSGTEYMADGSVYVGTFKANRKSGSGKLTNSDTGYRYEGGFEDDSKNGYGRLYSSDVLIYEGEFKSGLRSGQGISYTNGSKDYEGEFANDLKNGTGTSYSGGVKDYYGQFKNDLRDGYGTLYDTSGNVIFSGLFKEGVRVQ